MQSIAVQWHRTSSVTDATVPEAALCSLFGTVGIDLQISEGAPLAWTPESSGDLDDLDERFRPADAGLAAGHLFLVDSPASGRPSVLGEVCGTTHGLAIVYVGRLRDDMVANSMLAVCAHEIGHMCNLTHGLAVRSAFDSVMMQSAERDEAAASAWKRARDEALEEGLSPALFDAVDLPCLPFNHACRQALALPANGWRPWSGPFLGLDDGGREDAKKTAACDMLIHPARTVCGIGDTIAFDVELINTSRRKTISAPLNLDCHFGHLEVTITSQHSTRKYAPKTFACCDSMISILPGNSAFFPIALARDRAGDLIRHAGRHRITVELWTRRGKHPTVLVAGFDLTASMAAAPARAGAPPHTLWKAALRRADTRAPILLRQGDGEPARQKPNGASVPRAFLHSSILVLAAAMPATALDIFVEKMKRRFPRKEDATLHIHLGKRLQLTESRHDTP